MALAMKVGSEWIFTLAIAWICRGMLPAEYAFCTTMSMGRRRMSMRSTRSRIGMRNARLPWVTTL